MISLSSQIRGATKLCHGQDNGLKYKHPEVAKLDDALKEVEDFAKSLKKHIETLNDLGEEGPDFIGPDGADKVRIRIKKTIGDLREFLWGKEYAGHLGIDTWDFPKH